MRELDENFWNELPQRFVRHTSDIMKRYIDALPTPVLPVATKTGCLEVGNSFVDEVNPLAIYLLTDQVNP